MVSDHNVAPVATASPFTSLVSSAHSFSPIPVLLVFSWTHPPFSSLKLSGNMLQGLIPFPTLSLQTPPSHGSDIWTLLFITPKPTVHTWEASSKSIPLQSLWIRHGSLNPIAFKCHLCLRHQNHYAYSAFSCSQLLPRSGTENLELLLQEFFFWSWGRMSSDQWAGFPVVTEAMDGVHEQYSSTAVQLRAGIKKEVSFLPVPVSCKIGSKQLMTPQPELSFLRPWSPGPCCWREKNNRFPA